MDFTHSASLLVSLQDCSYRLSVVISEQSSQMQELRKQLSLTEEELHQLKRDKARMMGTESDHLQSLLREKEAFIKVRSFLAAFPLIETCHQTLTRQFFHQELMRGQEESMLPSSKDGEAELKALQEELQLLLKKEREAQVFVSWIMHKNNVFFSPYNLHLRHTERALCSAFEFG